MISLIPGRFFTISAGEYQRPNEYELDLLLRGIFFSSFSVWLANVLFVNALLVCCPSLIFGAALWTGQGIRVILFYSEEGEAVSGWDQNPDLTSGPGVHLLYPIDWLMVAQLGILSPAWGLFLSLCLVHHLGAVC